MRGEGAAVSRKGGDEKGAALQPRLGERGNAGWRYGASFCTRFMSGTTSEGGWTQSL